MKNIEDIENNGFDKLKSLQKQLKTFAIRKRLCKSY
jgi:hypothetical protein